MSLVLESLPKIAAEVSAPLSRVDEIVLLGGDGDRTTSEVTKLLAEMPPAVQALTGVDLSKILKQIPGAQ
jgi:flotillin